VPADRRGEQAQQRLVERRFGDPEVVALLDEMHTDVIRGRFGEPAVTRMYAEPLGHWRQGDPRPSLADDDPAVMQAIGRCAASRVRGDLLRIPGDIHPAPCGWCEYPLPELLAACDHATWASRFLLAEVASWRGAAGSPSYVRELRGDEYEAPRWREFYALSRPDRAARVARALATTSPLGLVP